MHSHIFFVSGKDNDSNEKKVTENKETIDKVNKNASDDVLNNSVIKKGDVFSKNNSGDDVPELDDAPPPSVAPIRASPSPSLKLRERERTNSETKNSSKDGDDDIQEVCCIVKH